MKILLVEDDAETADYIMNGLRQAGHGLDHAADGRDGMTLVTTQSYDVLIVDRMVPGLDGLSLVKALRSLGDRTPVLFLSALDGVDERVVGLEAGGDDYLIKPFAFAELQARINALGRRPAVVAEVMLKVGALEMDMVGRVVRRAGNPISLLPREWDLLEYLMRNAGRVVTRTMLLEHVWDFHFDPRTNVVETHISRLRQKVDRDYAVAMIQTVRGSGYALHASA